MCERHLASQGRSDRATPSGVGGRGAPDCLGEDRDELALDFLEDGEEEVALPSKWW
jgi:hypothetical protein